MSGTSLIGSEGLNQVKAQNEEHVNKRICAKKKAFFFFSCCFFYFDLFIFFFFPEKAQTQVP